MNIGLKSFFSKLPLLGYLGLLLTPLLALFLLKGEVGAFDQNLYELAKKNTLLLAAGVVLLSTAWGGLFSYIHCFYHYPLKKTLHGLQLMPLAFPSYVIAFIYLGLFGGGGSLSHWPVPVIQGELWFLIFVLSLALSPYVYFFSCIGLKSISQSEVETEQILGGGFGRFLCQNTLPKLFPYLISAQILVLFESVSDFGAASIVNVPVMTTMIYKLWFDLFSFSGAVQLSLRYAGIILLVLFIEIIFKSRSENNSNLNRDPVLGKKMGTLAGFLVTILMSSYVVLAFVLPLMQVLRWSVSPESLVNLAETFVSTLKTVGVGFFVGCIVLGVSVTLNLLLRSKNESSKYWQIFSTIGYSIPGSILAVAVYAILISLFSSLESYHLLLGLVIALSYKFLTVGMRPIGEKIYCLPQDLVEISRVLNVSIMQKVKVFLYPYLKESCLIALLLVMIEVMKEMPLTLMLAPSGFQTLSIKIFNYTSEGEWEKAALPSLMLVVVGIVSVYLINLKRLKQ